MEGPEVGEGDNVLNMSRLGLESLTLDQVSEDKRKEVQQLLLPQNRMVVLPPGLGTFSQLLLLDVSNNNLAYIGEEILGLTKLRTLLAKNNRLDEFSLPKELGTMRNLEVLNLSGNQFEEIPSQVLQLQTLKTLSMGGNRLKSIPADIDNMISLEFLYLGGNFITSIPPELANLPYLSYLVLCDNRIHSVPPQLAQIHSMRSLSLHNNLLTYLPREILSLVHLQELSLRGNPLVVRFVRDLIYTPPTLLE
ncbi:leucine-rich repeat-containing protein 58, partial [Bombina bombina]|uniref:leucine-rich repeat-containing protein 58 n=1 Tax=Bombina bombina TaxID=8345 RepID=UPI00235AF4F8